MAALHQLIYPLYYLDVLFRKSSVLGVSDLDFLNVRQVPIRPVPQFVFGNTDNLCDRTNTVCDVCLVHGNYLLGVLLRGNAYKRLCLNRD
jgi:hypothetical protein